VRCRYHRVPAGEKDHIFIHRVPEHTVFRVLFHVLAGENINVLSVERFHLFDRRAHEPRRIELCVYDVGILDRIEPHLGGARPTFVLDWPAPLGALARRKPDDPHTVERFELYAGGLELANAFGELTDPNEQRARFVAEAEIRRKRGREVYPIDEKLLDALATMPATYGIALGFDRLVMLVLGASSIREVMTFAHDEA